MFAVKNLDADSRLRQACLPASGAEPTRVRTPGTWFTSETAWIPQPTERHADLLGEFLALPGVHGMRASLDRHYRYAAGIALDPPPDLNICFDQGSHGKIVISLGRRRLNVAPFWGKYLDRGVLRNTA